MNNQQLIRYVNFLDKVRMNIIDNLHSNPNLKYLLNASYDRMIGIRRGAELDCLYAESELLEDERNFYNAFGINMEKLLDMYNSFNTNNKKDQADNIIKTAADIFIKYLVYTGTVIEMINLLYDKHKVQNLSCKFDADILTVEFENVSDTDTHKFFINFLPVDWLYSPKYRELDYSEFTLNFDGNRTTTIATFKQAIKDSLKKYK